MDESRAASDLSFSQVIDIWNTGETDRLPALLHPGYRGHMLHLERGERDAAGYPAHIQRFRSANSGVRFIVEDEFGDADRLCTRLSATRVDPETGDDLITHGINISRYVDGLMLEEWAVWTPWRKVSEA